MAGRRLRQCGVLPDGDIGALESHVLAAYLAGIRSAGLDLDEGDLTRWYSAAAAAHYAPIFAMYVESLRDADRVAALEARHGRPIDAITADKARVAEHALTLGESVL